MLNTSYITASVLVCMIASCKKKVNHLDHESVMVVCNKMADTMLHCLTCFNSAIAERFGIKVNFDL